MDGRRVDLTIFWRLTPPPASHEATINMSLLFRGFLNELGLLLGTRSWPGVNLIATSSRRVISSEPLSKQMAGPDFQSATMEIYLPRHLLDFHFLF